MAFREKSTSESYKDGEIRLTTTSGDLGTINDIMIVVHRFRLNQEPDSQDFILRTRSITFYSVQRQYQGKEFLCSLERTLNTVQCQAS